MASLVVVLAAVTAGSAGAASAPTTRQHMIPAGWSLVSVPLQAADPSAAAVFDELPAPLRLYGDLGGQTVGVGEPGFRDVEPGRASWLLLGSATTVSVTGIAVSEGSPFVLSLAPGWNAIGTPWLTAVPWSDTRVAVRRGTETIALSEAVSRGWIEGDLHVFEDGAYTTVAANAAGQLVPWRGALAYASAASDLVFTAPPPDTTPPAVAFTAPAEGDELSTSSTISATLDDPNLAQWTLQYSMGSNQPFLPLASGQTPVVSGSLGTVDPTLLENGPLLLRLVATDTAGNTTSVERTVFVTGETKVGLFRLSFRDLEVPLAGIPIAVTRTYDSRRRASVGDFGFGWTVEVEGRGRYINNRKPGDGWEFITQFLPCRSAAPTKPHITEIRLSDREYYRFALDVTSPAPTLGGCFGVAAFQPTGGYPGSARLEILGSTEVFWQNGSSALLDLDTFNVYQPIDVRLTLPSGRQYDLNLTRGITRVADLNGNVVTIGAGGIVHSSGRSVSFVRDGTGRIAQVVDPLGNTMTYAYDPSGDLVSFTDREDQTSAYTYSAQHAHLLEGVQDPRGIQPVRNEYDVTGRLLRHIDALGKVIEFTHDLDARQEVITDREGGTRILEYDERGNVVRETDPLDNVTSRTFDTRGNRLTETNGLNQTTTYTYDANDNVTSTRDPLGNVTTATYNARNQVLTRTDGRGKTTTNTYDPKGNLLSMTDPLGTTTTFTYDAAGNPETIPDALGNVTRLAYDAAGNLTRETDALGHVTNHTYDAAGNRLTTTTTRTTASGPATLVTTFAYDRMGRLVEVTDPDGTSRKTVYDALGNVAEKVDKLDRTTGFTYDEIARLTKTTYPDGTTEEYTYDAEGRRLTTRDRSGRVTQLDHDAAGRVVKTTYADGSVTTSVFDDAGRLASAKDTRGNTTSYDYDAAGLQTKVTDALGNAISTAYDRGENPVSTTDAKGQTTGYEFDDGNRRIKVTWPDGTTTATTYDAVGRPIAETDQAGKTTRFGYDAIGRLIAVTDALGQVTAFAYDEIGNRTRQTDANGHVTRFEYDDLGRETRRILPDGQSEIRTYDAVGNPATRTDFAGRVTTYTYDVNDRLAARAYPDGSSAAFTYTPTGQRASAADGRGTTSYAYTVRDRVSRLTDPSGRRLDFGYDTEGHRTALSVTSGATTLATVDSYDAANRLQTVTDPNGRAYGFTHDPNGNRAALQYPNGVRTTYAHNRLNRLTSLVTQGAGVIQSYAYTLDPAGNRTQVQEDGSTRQFTYDALYRLTGETVAGVTSYGKTFAHDPVGNRLTQTTSGSGGPGTPTGPGTVGYSYDTRDRLLAGASATYTYDDNGNVVTKSGTAAYTWDFENRLVRVVKADGVLVEHAYDADGNRVQTRITPATGPPTVTNFIVDPTGPLSHVVAETDGLGGVPALYVRGGDDLLAVVRGTGTRFYHADGIGSVRRLTDEAGTITDSYEYTAFGELIAHAGTDPQPYAFAGEPYEPNSGLQYHRARWLDPKTGRFAGIDPFDGVEEDPRTLHKYLYAHGDPVNFGDPSGLFEFSLAGLNVSINIQSGLRTSSGAINRAALTRLRSKLLSLDIRSVRLVQKIPGRQVHHLIEKRLLKNSKQLQKVFSHADDIPGVSLTPAEHQVFTNAWRVAFPRSNQVGHVLKPTLDEILAAASKIYANHPHLLKAIYLALL